MKKLQFIFAAVALLVLSLGMTGCDPNDPNNPDNPATSEIVSTSETNNGDGIVVEVIYKNNIRLYFELTSPTECALTLYQDYYGRYKEGFEQYAYSGDLVIPETITHKGVTYTVTDISYGVREYSGNVTTVWIPKTVIDDNIIRVVQYWWELTAINVATDNPKFASVDGHLFDNTKTKFLCYARANTGESYTVPDGVKEIYKNAFLSCEKLQTITIPNGVIEIGADAFYFCSGLTTFQIPNSVTLIDMMAFAYCKGLASITCLALVPPVLFCHNNSPFDGSSIRTVKVPAGSVEAYRAAVGWRNLTIVAL